ncbi:hypothetical protein BC827DRAFT_180606 [Russula dissimulans]|nr:hypothetical protein BC827DRAFT_180606 [Russula dissimulans]
MNSMTRFVYSWADPTAGRDVLFYCCPSACPTKSRSHSRCSLPHSFILPTATHPRDTSTLLLTRRMQHASDANHLAYISDAIYPVGPDASGEITYVHVPPLSPLTILVVVLACMAVGAFIYCYTYPLVQKCCGARTRTAKDHIKRPVLASARSLFGLRTVTTPPTTPQHLARYGYGHGHGLGLGGRAGRLDMHMRIARPRPALSLSRGSLLSPSLSPSLSSSDSASSSPSPSPTPMETGRKYLPEPVPEVIVAPVDVGILGQTVGSRTTPTKKGGGGRYDSGQVADDE